MKVGYVGLGLMGRGMAHNLVRSEHEVVVFDAVPAAMAPLVEAGAVGASSLAELAQQCDVVLTSLPGPPEVEAVHLGDGGLLANIRPNAGVFDLSTSSRELALRLHDAYAAAGAYFLDAPVSGGPAGSASGDLAFWVGGDKEAYERFLPVLLAMGDKPKLCGPIGAGTTVKLVNNLTGHLILRSLAETFSMGTKAGIDPLELWDAMRLGVVGKQPALDMLTKHFLPGQYDVPSFALRLAVKDVVLATEMADSLHVPMALSDVTKADMVTALEQGLGDKDARAYLQLQLDRAGVSIAVDPEDIAARLEA